MGYEKEALARARARYQEAVDRYQRVQQERRERVYREYPRVQELDQQLRRTMAEFMAETFRNGQNPKEAVELLRRKISICSRSGGIFCAAAAMGRIISRMAPCAGFAAIPAMWGKKCAAVWRSFVRRSSGRP